MNYEEAYRWLHGDRVEYSGCRAAAEAMEAKANALRGALLMACNGLAIGLVLAQQRPGSDDQMIALSGILSACQEAAKQW